MSQLQNTQGLAPGNVKSRTSLFYANVIPAGQTLTVPVAGKSFYVTASSAPITIKPDTAVKNTYTQGTGLNLDVVNSFSVLQVGNPNAFSVTFQIFVGFDEYLDKRLYLSNSTQPQVAYPTQPLAAVATVINVLDLSGQQFRDINGKLWYALSRTSMVISNVDTGATILLQKLGSIIGNGVSVCPIFPATNIKLELSGDYTINNGGAPINAIVCEIYAAISA